MSSGLRIRRKRKNNVAVQYLHTYGNLPRSFPSDAWQITGRIIYQKTFVRKQIPIPLLYEGLFLHILFFRIVLIIEFFESETFQYHIISVASVV